jgi:anti-sigma B factor antagonist
VTELSVSVSVEDGAGGPRSVVRLVGEADITTRVLNETLDAETAKRPGVLLVDASGLTFIDSSALHQIVRAHRRLRASGCLLAIVAPSKQVARILALTGLDTVVPVCATAEEAGMRRQDAG